MKNYVVRFTDSRYGRTPGYFANGQTPCSRPGTPDLSLAYVYNTRMNRRGIPHRMAVSTLEDCGLEIVPLTLVIA